MAKSINLLPKSEFLLGEEYRKLLKIKKIGVWFLVVIAVFAFGIFVYGQILVLRQTDFENKISNLKASIETSKEKEILARLTKQKASGIETVLENRIDFSFFLDDIFKVLIPGVSVTGLSVNSDGSITSSVNTVDSNVLTGLLNNLGSSELGGKYFKNFKVDRLLNDRVSGYDVNFEVKANELKN